MNVFPKWNHPGSLFAKTVVRSRVRFWYGFVSVVGVGKGSGTRFGSGAWFGLGFWFGSQIETLKMFVSQTQNTDLKLTNISELNPRVLIPKRNWQLGFKLRGNQLELGQKFEEIVIIVPRAPNIPMLILKEVEIVGRFKRKMRFCLIGEELWLVFR